MYTSPVLTTHHEKHPGAYYATEADHPTAHLAHQIRRSEYQLWTTLLPDEDADYDLAVTAIHRLTGKGRFQIGNALAAVHRLTELPLVREIQDTTHRLDLSRLIAIDKALCLLTDETLLALIDTRLALYLLPTRLNQLLPSAGQITARIRDWIRLLAPTLDVDHTPDPPAPPTFSAHHGDDGRSYLNLDAPTDVALIIEAALRARVAEAGCSEAEALRDLVTGAARVRVVLNLYRAHDVEDAPAYVFGAGWLTPQVSNALADTATQVRDMDKVATKVAAGYQTPEDIRAFVVGRDGTCRGPGDNRSAADAQMDHSVDWAAGGPTCADNLASLCAHCHNIKTDGRMFPVRLPEGEIVWLFEDGTWVHSVPEGPLSAKARNWVQTLGQRITRRREHHHAPDREQEEGPTEQPEF
ncbi:HNH endonuclease signature motif containing protein [Corynebacterium doosanense]|uniref:HNH nuclease domain-containing protein n=1 Tax=Corynebacterium doosanense CAU 212 = DSM 45436 TaxID=558173 RepID=A0A097IHE1_9CORY|nr:HNH endonuclease signature motif containing protein [Corynebacterium doosanense]AIT61550.1 hypothetical protein CDOO_09915 [Corynebacterium doosanense CAU 212 = DSM 45436]